MKITICGSIGFYKEMESARDELIKQGHEVKIPELALEVPKEFGGGKKVYFGQYIEQNGGIDSFPAGHEIWNMKEEKLLEIVKNDLKKLDFDIEDKIVDYFSFITEHAYTLMDIDYAKKRDDAFEYLNKFKKI